MKDLFLLLSIPLIIIVFFVYNENNPNIIGRIVNQPVNTAPQEQENNILGTYTINPSFKVKEDYDLENEYKNIQIKLDNLVDKCKNDINIEECLKSNSIDWRCKDEDADILYDFIDKLQQCKNLAEENVVCRFNLDERDLNTNQLFTITLTSEEQTKIELKKGSNIQATLLATDYIDLGKLYSTEFDNKDTVTKDVASIQYKLRYEDKKPMIEDTFAIDANDKLKIIPLSKELLLYKTKDKIKFIEAPGSAFRAPVANKIINLPKTKGMKFCVESKKQLYTYDEKDSSARLRPIVYKFAVTYPKQIIPPNPIENLEVLDALKAENSVILTWDKSKEDNIKSYSFYYLSQDFIDKKIEDIKKDTNVKKKSIAFDPAAIEKINDIKLEDCKFDKVGAPCKYALLDKPLEKDKLYYWTSKNKLIYLINDVKDDVDYNYAVTSVNDEEAELNNDKTINGNAYVLTKNNNYKSFISKDDLAPNKVENLITSTTSDQKLKLSWSKPANNIDGTQNTDTTGFGIYYKKDVPSAIPGILKVDMTYTRITVTALQANCELKLNCEFILDNIQKNQVYSIAVTALDKNSNEYTDNADVMQYSIS